MTEKDKSDILKPSMIGKNFVVKTKNYSVVDYETGEEYSFVEGTKIPLQEGNFPNNLT